MAPEEAGRWPGIGVDAALDGVAAADDVLLLEGRHARRHPIAIDR